MKPLLTPIKALFWHIQGLIFGSKNWIPVQDFTPYTNNPNQDPFHIQKLNASHIPQLLQLLASITPSEHAFFNPHPFDASNFQKLFSQAHYHAFGCFKNKQLLGYIFIRCIFHKSAYAGYFVDAKYRQKGIAKKLFNHIRTFCKLNSMVIKTSISPQNLASLKTGSNYKIIRKRCNGDLILKYD